MIVLYMTQHLVNMAVTHFRVSKNTVRLDLKKANVAIVVDESHPIAEENEISVVNNSGFKSESLDSFSYQLSIDGGVTWSNEGICKINDFAGTGTPGSVNETINLTNENQSSTPVLNINANTDRIKILGAVNGNAAVLLNGQDVLPDELVFSYDLANLAIGSFLGAGAPYDEIQYQCGNHLGINTAEIFKVTVNVALLAEIAFVSRAIVYSNETVSGKNYVRINVIDTLLVTKGYILGLAKHTIAINSDMLALSIHNAIFVDEETRTANENFLYYKNANDVGQVQLSVIHSYLDFTGVSTTTQITTTLTDIDGDAAKVSVINSDISSYSFTGLAAGAVGAVTEYRSSYESNNYYYAGYLDGSTIVIKRVFDSVVETASGLTDLEVDWTNRFSLTYS